MQMHGERAAKGLYLEKGLGVHECSGRLGLEQERGAGRFQVHGENPGQ